MNRFVAIDKVVIYFGSGVICCNCHISKLFWHQDGIFAKIHEY